MDVHKSDFGVEPICQQLQIAPSTYYRHKQLEKTPELRAQRIQQDERLVAEIQRIWHESDRNYGARKIWKQLRREGFDVARCTVERLMRQLGIEGLRRGKKCKTTIPDNKAHCRNIWLTVTLKQTDQINSGLLTLLTSPRGQALCASLL